MKRESEKRLSDLVPPPIVLTIAGFDPSSGAGITADLKVFAAHRLYGVAAMTALTVQSTQGVRRTEPVGSETLEETLDCLAADVEIAGVKIGMLATAGNVAAVLRFLDRSRMPRDRIVLDPMIRSSSGRELIDRGGFSLLRQELMSRIGWITPNIGEMSGLLDREGQASADSPKAAADFQQAHPGTNVIITGGDTYPPNDFLRTTRGEEHWLAGEWIETRATHGTGCAFSSALLCALVAGQSELAAARAAKSYVKAAMVAAYPIGKGYGPLHHLWRLESLQ